MDNPHVLLANLGLSGAESELYLALNRAGAMTAQELVTHTHQKRPTVYYALRQLEERGLVHKSLTPGVARFQAEPPDKLLSLLTLKHREVEELERRVRDLIPQLATPPSESVGRPNVLFYEGETAVKQVIMDTLYCQGRHIDSLAPSDNFFWQTEGAFSENYIAERVRRKITTRNLWERPLAPEIMLRTYKGLSQIRILPKAMHGTFKTTVFLFDDKVLYISSRSAGYALLVKSPEHYQLMRAVYDGLWSGSTAVGAKRKS